MQLRTLLLRSRDVDVDADADTDTDTDTDAQLELALLRLWSADAATNVLEAELLALDDKCWRRLGLLLFASDDALVRALVAVLERLAARQDKTDSRERILRRVWQTPWREHLREKVADCQRAVGSEEEDDEGRNEDLAARLVQVLGASLRAVLALASPAGDGQLMDGVGVDVPGVMEVVGLLLSVATTNETSPTVARAAAVELLSLLSLGPHPLSGLMTTHICRSAVMQHCAAWLLGDEAVPVIGSASTATKQPIVLNLNGAVSEKLDGAHRCDPAYLDLLAAAATLARPDADKRSASRSVALDDTAVMLQICTLGIARPRLQLGALRLLCALLALDDASASALSSAVRLSGILISISWLVGHTDPQVAATAGTTLEIVIQHSPPSDILRAIIEQGCVIIYRAFLSTASGAKRNPAQAAVVASCRSLLNWVTDEVAWQTGVIAGSVQSILSSTNVLLQKNIILTLQILAQRNAAIRETLEDQEFLTDALVAAIQADDDAGLAVSLLSASLNCCDKCSTLKISSRDSIFQCSSNDQETAAGEVRADTVDEKDHIVHLRCAGGELITTSAPLLREHSNLLRGWKQPQNPIDSSIAIISKLDKFHAPNVQLLVDLISKTQQEAATALTELQSLPTLEELLRLADVTESAKCWHSVTSAICRMLSAVNWLEVLQFASTDVRHPMLALRCIRFGLELHSASSPQSLLTHETISKSDAAEQERAGLTSALKTAAIQMVQELFAG